jgi:sec-independent protein translocase protein TatC
VTAHEPPDEQRRRGRADGEGTDEPQPVAREDKGTEAPTPPGPARDTAGTMSLIDHLEELRRVIMQSLIAAVLAMVVCWLFSARLLDLLVAPLGSHEVYFYAPNEAFMVRLKIAGVGGLFAVVPFVLFKVYGFVVPGLYDQERRVVTPLLIVSTLLFYLGVAFAFLVVTPQVMRFMLSFGTDLMEPLIGIGPYFSFVARICLAFGIVFELPLVVLFLSALGLVDPKLLLRTWRYALLIVLVFSAVLTPPDAFSQVLMAGPVLLLYIGSVLVAIAVTARRRRREREDDRKDESESDPEGTPEGAQEDERAAEREEGDRD